MPNQEQLKYYLKIDTIELEVKNYPKSYPVIWGFTSNDIKEIKGLLVKANLLGMNELTRKICFSDNCKEGIQLSEAFETAINIAVPEQEIQKEYFDLVMTIPAWNPINDIKIILLNYIQCIQEIQEINAAQEAHEMEELLEEFEEEIEEVHEWIKEYIETNAEIDSDAVTNSDDMVKEVLDLTENNYSERAIKTN